MSERPPELLKLAAEDADDLVLVAAQLQDAITMVGDLTYLPGGRRFVAVFNRFMWDGKGRDAEKPFWRCHAGLEVRSVLGAKIGGIPRDEPKGALELLTLSFAKASEDPEDPSGAITLVFAGGGAVRLDVECVEVYMRDYGEPWRTARRPSHPD
ncbi:MAG: DUF2948 family protein [Alphaproteobacteria bacterium]|nr:DUF2948 family protein [Alphaproteobacteria bacterium]